jgi:hypothetical protein
VRVCPETPIENGGFLGNYPGYWETGRGVSGLPQNYLPALIFEEAEPILRKLIR